MLDFVKKAFRSKISSPHIRIIGYVVTVGIAKLMPTNPLIWIAAGGGIYITEKLARVRAVEEGSTFEQIGIRLEEAITGRPTRTARYSEVKP